MMLHLALVNHGRGGQDEGIGVDRHGCIEVRLSNSLVDLTVVTPVLRT